MHDDHAHEGTHGQASGKSSNPWPDRVNEAYYDHMGETFGRQTRARINWMCSQAKPGRALDVGCSQGIAAILMAREGKHVLAIDIFQPAIDYANDERAKEIQSVQDRVEFRCTELAALKGMQFDTILMGEVIEHQTDVPAFISQAVDLCAPEGRIVITVPFGYHPWPDHKATVFPDDLLDALRETFEISVLDVVDGYIRCVANRILTKPSLENSLAMAIGATEAGAWEVQKRNIELSASLSDAKKVIADYKAEAGKRGNASSELTVERALHKRSSETIVNLSEELAALRLRSEVWIREAAEQKSVVDELGRGIQVSNHESALLREQLSVLQAEVGRLGEEVKQGHEELSKRERELERARASLRLLGSKDRDHKATIKRMEEGWKARDKRQKDIISTINEELTELKLRMKTLQETLVDAQHKRSSHWAKLEAERARAQELIQLCESLHNDNQLYRNSLALALGQALIALKSPRGIVGFPKAVAAILLRYRRRGTSNHQSQALSLPKLRHVHIPDPKKVVDDFAVVANPQAERNEEVDALSIDGWEEVRTGKPLLMGILDEFTLNCLQPTADWLLPRPDNWRGLLEKFQPTLLFVESAWNGNHQAWQYRVARSEYMPGAELVELVEACKLKGIPTVFWNKEDPLHYGDFIQAAAHFDCIFTTSIEAKPRYAVDADVRSVDLLQFAAQEAIHNPIQSGSPRESKVCYAGSFYPSLEERSHQQTMLLDAASGFDLDIFDRNYSDSSLDSQYQFPERHQRFVRGKIQYSEIGDVYRKYRVFLNVNSIQDSDTMFSRRVFELLACGTPVVSTPSPGFAATFGPDVVWEVATEEEARHAIDTLLNDDKEFRRRSAAGIRAVMSRHTYRHRMEQVMRTVMGGSKTATRPQRVRVVLLANQDGVNPETISWIREQRMCNGESPQITVLGNVPAGTEKVGFDSVDGDPGMAFRQLVKATRASDEQLVLAVGHQGQDAHQIEDLLQASRYSRAGLIGMAVIPEDEYRLGGAIARTCLLINSDDPEVCDAAFAFADGTSEKLVLKDETDVLAIRMMADE
ncbi:glycosyltransferase [Pseudoxanthomonas sp. z9]|uniref:glycosyltransferase family protein n=1 Tax=Pseudoxanthomonas sp. z9 TaxID=2584942 RepID=UPI001143F23C|nr:glycosyltransferase [Pseudoxanthomonas sp. z9]